MIARGALIHVTTDDLDALRTALGSAANLHRAAPDLTIEVVCQGAAVRRLLAPSPLEPLLSPAPEWRRVLACDNSLQALGATSRDLASDVGHVPAAIAHLVARQGDGWAYVKLP